jgi:Prokaryotic RING finger family 4
MTGRSNHCLLCCYCTPQWGEYRDRRKRWQYAEQRSKLSSVERHKAQQLQKVFRTKCCPICLENYDYGDSQFLSDDSLHNGAPQDLDKNVRDNGGFRRDGYDDSVSSLVSLLGDSRKGIVDEFGIPRRGADGRKIKLLRCGHIFCETCWESWVHSSACGSPCSCPVCRQDVGKSLSRGNRRPQSLLQTSVASGGIMNESEREGTMSSATVNRQLYEPIPDVSTSPSSSRQFVAVNSSGTRIIRVNTMIRGAILFRQTSSGVEHRMDGSQDGEAVPLLAA